MAVRASILRASMLALLSSVIALPVRAADVGHIAVQPHAGASYARENVDARRAAASQFIVSHSDSYDFLIVFPTFAADLGPEVRGLYTLVRNDVQGIGIPLSNGGASFGSASRLKGYIDISSLMPGSPVHDLDATLALVAHELAHQWSGQALYMAGGQVRDDLLGAEHAHWSFFLDSEASVLYGSKWSSDAPGMYTSVESFKRYSALDLYLMGLLAPEEVPPLTLLRPAAGGTHGAEELPPLAGTRIAASAEQVTLPQIVAALGPRSPGAASAQRVFRAAFVILTPPGQQPTAEQVAFVDSVRREWANRFFFMSRGRAFMETDLVEKRPDPIPLPPGVSPGLDYLLSRQAADGSWADSPTTRVRDTQLAVQTLALMRDPRVSDAVARAAAFLASVEVHDVDSSARRVLALAAAHRDTAQPRAELEARVAAAGAANVGPSAGYRMTPIDTALAAAGLSAAGGPQTTIAALADALRGAQNADGSWPFTSGGPGRIEPTAAAVGVLARLVAGGFDGNGPRAGLDALAARGQQSDGTYFDDLRSASATSQVFLALVGGGRGSELGAVPAALRAMQRADGSWAGSISQTALALEALRVAATPNLEIPASELTVSASDVVEGDRVTVTARVRNLGMAAAPAGVVRVYDQDGGVLGEAHVPALAAGASTPITLSVDTSGRAGSARVYVVADPDDLVDELREDDNRAGADLRIAEPPLAPDLFVAAGTVLVTPAPVDRLPIDLVVSATVGNTGRTPVTTTVAVLVAGQRVGNSAVTLPARSSQQLQVPVHLARLSGAATLEVRADPDGLVAEPREYDNAASAPLPLAPTVDLAMLDIDVVPDPAEQGTDVTFGYTVGNAGTVDGSAAVSFTIRDAAGRIVATLPPQSFVVGGGTVASRTATWRATAAGALTVEIRAAAAQERSPADNVATAPFQVNPGALPNLAIRPGDLTVDPDPPRESQPSTARVMVRNDGGAPAAPFAVELRIGPPGQLGSLLRRFDVAGLAPGEEVALEASFTPPNADRNELVAHVDPSNLLPEVDEADNAALRTLDPAPIPNLVVAELDIRPDSVLPREGITLPIVVSVLNAGGQDASAVPVELYLGDPELGGHAIGTATLDSVPANGRTEAQFALSTAGLAGIYRLVVLVNADRRVVERRYDDDRAAREIVVQDGPVAVTNPVFSPNGDGVKDTTELFYRGAGQSAVEAKIVDRYGRTVRTVQGSEGGAPLVWDGLRDDRAVAWDGGYDVRISSGSQALGSVRVTVDTNRSQVHEAAGTEYLSLGPPIWGVNTATTPHSYVDATDILWDDGGAIGGALLQWTLRGVGVKDIRPVPPMSIGHPDLRGPYSGTALAPDSDRIAVARNGLSPGLSILSRSLRTELLHYEMSGLDWDPATSQVTPIEFTNDGQHVLAVYLDRLLLLNTEQLDSRVLDVGEILVPRLSPDGRRAAYLWNGELRVVDLVGGEPRALVPRSRIGGFNFYVGTQEYVDPYNYRLGSQQRQFHAWISPHEVAFLDHGERVTLTTDTECEKHTRKGTWHPTPCYIPKWSGITVLDVDTLAERSLFRAAPGTELQLHGGAGLAASPRGDVVAFKYTPGLGTWETSYTGPFPGNDVWIVSTVTGDVLPLVGGGNCFNIYDGKCLSWPARWSPQGTFMWSPGSWSLETYANLRAHVTASRPPGGAGLVFNGTAIDLNFEEYQIAARRLGGSAPPVVIARSRVPVREGELARWTPPVPGAYEVTLTVLDQGGNAGSSSTVASWSDAPPLSGLMRDPEYLSPNGDGIQDLALVSYDVSSPLTTEFEIVDEARAPVRRFQRTHEQPGSFSFQWDGRNDVGGVLPDGSYQLTSDAGEVAFTLDTVAPAVEMGEIDPGDGFRCGRASASDGGIWGALVPVLTANMFSRADDPHLATCMVEAGPSAAGPFAEEQSCSAYGSEVGARLARGVSYRARARDRAGNEAVSAPVALPEQLMVTAVGRAEALAAANGFLELYGQRTRRIDKLESWCAGKSAPTFEFAPVEYGIALDTTIAEPLVAYAVAYRRVGAGEQEPWTVDATHVTPIDELTIVWDARTVPQGKYEGQVRVVTASGREFVAPFHAGGYGYPVSPGTCVESSPPGALRLSFKIFDAPLAAVPVNAEFRLSPANEPSITELVIPVHPEEQVGGPEYHAELALTSLSGCAYDVSLVTTDDPGSRRIAAERVDVCRLHVDDVRRDGEVLTLVLEESFKQAVTSIDVFAWTPGVGQRPLGTVPGFEGRVGPLRFSLPATECGASSQIRAVAHLADGTTYEGSQDAHGTCDPDPVGPGIPCARTPITLAVEANREHPAACSRGTSYAVTANVSASSSSVVSSVSAAGQAIADGARRTIPMSFASGARVEATGTFSEETFGTSAVSLTVQARDSSGASATVTKVLPGADLVAPTLALTQPAAGAYVCANARRGPDGAISGYSFDVRGAVADSRLRGLAAQLARDGQPFPTQEPQGYGGQPSVQGTLARLECTPAQSGDYLVRIVAADDGGSACTAPVPFHLDCGALPAATIALASAIFSPDGDGAFDTTALSVTLTEAAHLTVEASSDADGGILLDATVGAGSTELQLGGVTTDAAILQDGQYTLRIDATDACGGTASSSTSFEIDTTRPVARIDSPAPGALIGASVDVLGQASDVHVQSYDLSIGPGTDPLAFTPLGSTEHEASGLLGSFTTTGLAPGIHTLRLQVRDAVGHLSEARVPVQVQPGVLVAALEVTPAAVSPDGNGVRDAAVASMDLRAPALILVELVDSQGVVRAVPLPPTSLPAGPYQVTLDEAVLLAANDGLHAVRVTAVAGSESEVEARALVVDRTPPEIHLTRPSAAGFVAGGTEVSGTISDLLLLAGWHVAAGSPGASLPVAEGRAAADGVLASLRALGDGPREVVVTAEDAAGNQAVETVTFTSDATPPEAGFAAPLDGAFVGSPAVIDVRGVATDANLAGWTVDLERAGARHTVLTGSAPVAGGALGSWDLGTEPDGPVDLVLRASDRAGNATERRISVTIDGTAPVVHITAPSDTFLNVPAEIRGDVSDDHLVSWTVEISDGLPGTAVRFTPLATGAHAANGVLATLASLPADGVYTLRLTAVDRAGHLAVEEVGFEVDTRPPAPPSALVAALQGHDALLTWAASPAPDAVRHRVMRVSGDGAPVQVAEVTGTAYTDAGLTDGTHRFTVVAVDRAGLASEPCPEAAVRVDAVPPVARIDRPAAGAKVPGATVEVTGTAFSDSDFKEYRLSIGAGSAPTSFTLLTRSAVGVALGRLGTFDASALAHGSTHTVRLETEDRAGNVGEARVTFQVDNARPARPTLLSATANGANVTVRWSANVEADLKGYLLYRNGVLVNAPAGAAVPNPADYALPKSSTTYVDSGLRDGAYRYQVQAIDTAGNLSDVSNALAVTIELSTPVATILTPGHLSRFDGPTTRVVADSVDMDLASVQFEVRAGNAESFTALGAPLAQPPYSVEVDADALGSDVIEVRAVAIDVAGNADPAPKGVVLFRELAMPAPSFTTIQNGYTVTVSPTSPVPDRVAAWRVVRDNGTIGYSPPPPGTVTASSSAPGSDPQAAYDGNPGTSWIAGSGFPQMLEITPSRPVTVSNILAQVSGYQIVTGDVWGRVRGVWVPIARYQAGSALQTGVPGLTVDAVRLVFRSISPGPLRVTEVELTTSGFVAAIPVQANFVTPGLHWFSVEALSAFGTSASAGESVRQYGVTVDPLPPMGPCAAVAKGRGAQPGATVRISRAGAVIATGIADASGAFEVPTLLPADSSTLSAQSEDANGNRSVPYSFYPSCEAAPTAAVSLALSNVSEGNVSLSFTVSGDSTGLAGLRVRRSGGDGTSATIASLGAGSSSYVDAGLPNGTYRYVVVPVSAHGYEGTPSNEVIATVAAPLLPSPSSLTVASARGALDLAWSYSGPPALGFLVERGASGAGPFGPMNGGALATADAYRDRDLAAGQRWFYRVRAVDTIGNAGVPSSVASGIALAADPPAPPVITAPTVAGQPISVPQRVVTVAGFAPGAKQVELLRNGGSAVLVDAAPASFHATPVVVSAGPADGLDVSPDGTRIAYPVPDPAGQGSRLVVQELGSGGTNSVLAAGLLLHGPRFSPDGRRVAIAGSPLAGGVDHIYLVELATGDLEPLLADLGGETDPAWSRDGASLAYVAFRGPPGTRALAFARVDDRVERVLGAPTGTEVAGPAWSRDDAVVAIARPVASGGDATLIRVDVASGSRIDLYHSPGLNVPLATSPLGDRIIVSAVDGSSRSDLVAIDVLTGAASALTSDAAEDRSPALSPDGTLLAAFSDGAIVLRDGVSGATIASGVPGYTGGLAWSRSGVLLSHSASLIDEIGWGGDFSFPGLELAPGDNVFAAIALDASGTPSAPSAPIAVTWQAPPMADLAVATDLQPRAPIAGDPTTALVTVTNRGSAASSSAALSVAVASADGSIRSAPIVSIPALLAGGATIVAVPLDVSGPPGVRTLWVVADPDLKVADADRSNNSETTTFGVSADDEVSLLVRADPSSVAPAGVLGAEVSVVNPGLPRDVAVSVFVEDRYGTLVLPSSGDQVYAPLARSTIEAFRRSFDTAGLFAGDYRIVAEASAAGIRIARGTAPVTILPELGAEVSLTASRAAYRTGDAVGLVARIVNTSANAFLSNAECRFHVEDALGSVVFEAAAPIPALAPGVAGTAAATLPGPGLAAGSYVATARITIGSEALASATVPLQVQGVPLLVGSAEVVGSTAVPPAVPAGADAMVAYSLANAGGAPAENVLVRLIVVDPDSQETLGEVDASLGSLAAAQVVSGTLPVPTAGLLHKTYGVSLSVAHGGEAPEVLATARFRVADAQPPLLALVNLTPGMFVPGAVTPAVRATDDESGVRQVRASVDGHPAVPLTLAAGSPLDGTWSGALALGADGPHTLMVSAADEAGNDGALSPSSGNPVTITIFSDSTSPSLTLGGIAEGALYSVPVVPTIAAADTNLASVTAVLDGAAFVPGTAVSADGDHVLAVQAVDRAANVGSASVRFTVDRTAPAIAISGVAEGAILAAPVAPVVRVSDRHPGAVIVTLNGQPFEAGTTVGADGAYVLSVQATDQAGNSAVSSLAFAIDRSAPDIVLGGFEDGAYVSATVTPTFLVQEADLLSIEATLNGRAFASGTPVVADGNYVLSVVALDRAGNRSERTGAFVVDRTPPNVTLSGFTEGAYVRSDVTPAFAATDVSLASVDATLDAIPFVSGMSATGEGLHVFRVVALDLAGNRTERIGTFTIDRTPPAITFSGFVEGSVVSVAAVTPRFDVTDANLAAVDGRLDGVLFVSGTAVSAEGVHTLVVASEDAAGNTAQASGTFTIDRAPPQVSIGGVTDGQVSRVPLVPTVAFADLTLVSSGATLDGQPFVSGTTVSSEGDHVLAASATDRADHHASTTVTFAIDTTPPAITISGVQDGGVYASAVSPVVTVTDAHLASSTILLDGAQYVSGTPIAAAGPHTLDVSADDIAGNHAAAHVAFTIQDAACPSPEPLGPRVRVYDEALVTCFEAENADAHDLAYHGLAHGGTTSIAFTPADWKWLKLTRTGLRSRYAGLEFWVHGGASGGQVVTLEIRSGPDRVAFVERIDDLIGGPIPGGRWTRVTAPFKFPTRHDDLTIAFKAPEEIQPTIYIDDVTLVADTSGPCSSAAGQPCSDGNVCNGVELCDGAGSCVGALPLHIDDQNPCTVDTCDPVQGARHLRAAAGFSCFVGEACGAFGVCSAAGACQPTTSPNDVRIYSDRIETCFYDSTYVMASLDLYHRSVVHGGDYAVRCEPGAWDEMAFEGDVGASFDTLELWIHGGTTGGQDLMVFVDDEVRQLFGGAVAAALGHPIAPGTWQRVTMPFSRASRPGWIWIRVQSPTQNAALYLDDVRLLRTGKK